LTGYSLAIPFIIPNESFSRFIISLSLFSFATRPFSISSWLFTFAISMLHLIKLCSSSVILIVNSEILFCFWASISIFSASSLAFYSISSSIFVYNSDLIFSYFNSIISALTFYNLISCSSSFLFQIGSLTIVKPLTSFWLPRYLFATTLTFYFVWGWVLD